jgi:hypothetical protein
LDLQRSALSRTGLGANAPAVGFDDRSGDGESEAATSAFSGSAAVHAVEALEDSFELVRRDPGSCIADLDAKLAVVRPRGDRHPIARLGMSDSVADEVVKHLGEPVGIGIERAFDGVEMEVAIAE